MHFVYSILLLHMRAITIILVWLSAYLLPVLYERLRFLSASRRCPLQLLGVSRDFEIIIGVDFRS